MSHPVSFARAEPAVFIGLLQALAQSALGVLTVFGLDLEVDQIGAIHGLVAATLAVVGAVWTRGQVTPTASLEQLAPAEVTIVNEPDEPIPTVAATPVKKAAKKRRPAN